jgi:hypothetical protein
MLCCLKFYGRSTCVGSIGGKRQIAVATPVQELGTLIPAMPVSSNGRLPTRSMSHIETRVMTTFTVPMPAVARIEPCIDEIPAVRMIYGA